MAEFDNAIALADNLEQALVDASGSYDSVVRLCDELMAAEAVLRKGATRERIRGQMALVEDVYRKAQRLAEYRLRGYRVIGSAWREAEKAKGGRPKQKGKAEPVPSSNALSATDLGTNRITLHRYALAAEVPEERFLEYLQEANARGAEYTLSALVKIAKAQRKAKERMKLEMDAVTAAEEISDEHIIQDLGHDRFAGQFHAIYADPPWGYDDDTMPSGAEDHYPTMSIDDIVEQFAPRIKSLAHPEGAHFWLWTTWPMLRDGCPQRLLEASGFSWKGEIVWDKGVMGMGRWIRKRTEVLILGVRGNLMRMRDDLEDLVQIEHSRVHSQKPEGFREIVESFSPGPYLELFARNPEERDNWWYFGNEAHRKEDA